MAITDTKPIGRNFLIDALKSFKSKVLDSAYLATTTDTSNKDKAVVVDENGKLVFGDAGVQVSAETGNTIETKADGIYVAAEVWQGTKAEYEALDKSTLIDGQTVIITDDFDGTKVVTTWSETTSDGNVPSEKLVKDSLDDINNSLSDIPTYPDYASGMTNIASNVTGTGSDQDYTISQNCWVLFNIRNSSTSGASCSVYIIDSNSTQRMIHYFGAPSTNHEVTLPYYIKSGTKVRINASTSIIFSILYYKCS